MPDEAITETILHQANGREVLISNQRIVLGKETWPTDSVAHAQLVTEYDRLSPLEINSDLGLLARRAPGIALIVLGVLLFWLLPFSLELISVVLVLGAIGTFISVLALNSYRKEIYRVRLRLRRGPALYSDYEALYTWRTRPAAQKVIVAIGEAVRTRKDTSDNLE